MPDGSASVAGKRAKASAPGMGSAWRPLGYAPYRAFWLSSGSGYVGIWMLNVGAAWLMATLTASPLRVAAVQWALSVPVFLLALPAGALADRMDRRRILLWTYGGALVAALALAAVTLCGWISPLTLLLGTALFAACMSVGMPAAQSAVADLVPRADLAQAIMLGGLSFNTARSIGPALAGLIIVFCGAGVVFLASALACVAMLCVAARLPLPAPRPRARRESLLVSARMGLAYAQRTPAVRVPLLSVAVFCFSAAAVWALLPLLVQGHGGGGYGMLLASLGIGAVLSAFMAPSLLRLCGDDKVTRGAALLFAAASWAAAATAAETLPWAWMMVAGFGWALALNTTYAGLQSELPAWVRARCLALYLIAVQGGLALGSLVWGAVAEQAGVAAALSWAAACAAIGMLLTGPRNARSHHAG